MRSFEVFMDRRNRYRFRLIDESNEALLISVDFHERSQCYRCIDLLKKNARSDVNFERRSTYSGHSFNFLIEGNTLLASGELHEDEAQVEQLIGRVKDEAPLAVVIDLTTLLG